MSRLRCIVYPEAILGYKIQRRQALYSGGCATTYIKQTCAIYIHLLSLCIYPQDAITICCAHLHHTLAALKRYFPASLVAPLPKSEQINHPSSYIHQVDAKSHALLLFPLCNTRIHNTHHLFNCTHIRTTLSPIES